MSNTPVLGRDLRLSQAACYHGPNVWSSEPALVCHMTIDPAYASHFAEGAARLARRYPDWVDASLLALPGSDDKVAKVVAQWALGALNEVCGYLHAAGGEQGPDGLTVWVGFHHPRVSGLALEVALRALTMASARDDFSADLLQADLDELWQLCRRHHPDYQARILMTAARQKGIPVLPLIPGTKYWQYGWGARSRVFMESLSNADGNLAGVLSASKPLSKSVFAALGMPTPRHVVISDAVQLDAAASAIGFPCVVKPLNLGGGKGVTAGIETVSQLHVAYELARRVTDGPLMVEQFVPGDDHRLMVIGGKLVAAIRREASCVVGDGKSSIGQLIDRLNADRTRNLVKSGYLLPIAFDDALRNHLARQDAGIDSVPPAGSRITLRGNANMSTGGVVFDVTDRVHPAVTALAEQLAVTVGLGTAGLDYLTTDITLPPLEGHGVFIEMNTTPGLELVAAGWPDEKLGSLVLGELPGRIPVDLCVVPALDGEAARRALPEPAAASSAAWVCGEELRVGHLEARIADALPWAAVRSALRNKTVTSVRIVSTVDEILAHGLPVDRIDRVVLAGVSFPERWQAVIERCANSVVFSSQESLRAENTQ